MSILITILLKKEKEEYVDLIDDALIDLEGTQTLERLLHGIRHVVVPTSPNQDRSSGRTGDNDPSAGSGSPEAGNQAALDNVCE